MRLIRRAALCIAAFPAAAGTAQAATSCKVGKLIDLPVTMNGLRPLVTARINGIEGSFIVDSGSFYGLISPGMANAAKLRLTPAPDWFHLSGIGGETKASYTTVKDLVLAGQKLPPLDFFVGGSDTGLA